jgi:oligosaccharide reducing-end xylanase
MRETTILAVLFTFALAPACVPRQQPKDAPAAAPASSVSSGPPITPAGAPGTGAFQTGRYRNVFVELGHPEAEVKAKIESGYRQLFHGSPDSEAVFFEAGQNADGKQAYIMDIGNEDVRSEGMSYGMMLAVQMNQQDDFDALWNWAKSHMYHADPKHPCYGYFSWQMRPDGTAMDEMPAPDAEEYIITALFFASHRWGDGEGIYDYGEQALGLLDRVKNRQEIQGTVNGSRVTSAVALFNPEHKMVRFTPDAGSFKVNGDHTDPSYHLPAFYELWARWAPEQDRAFWAEAARASRDFFVRAAHPRTGLVPDYAEFDGRPKAASWDPNTVHFRFDAWRVPMNWGVDAIWWAADPREQELSNRILAFFAGAGPSYAANFSLEGKPLVTYHSLGLAATNAVAALVSSLPEARDFVETLWASSPPTGQWRYYDGMLYLMGLLHASGEFRIYDVPGAAVDVTRH